MNGFVGEFLILLGAFSTSMVKPAGVYTAIAATGVILSAVYMLWMFQRVNYGPVTNAKNRGLRDLSIREWCVIGPVCAVAIFMGVVPGVFLKPMEASVKRTVEHVVGSARNARALGDDQAPGLGPQAPALTDAPGNAALISGDAPAAGKRPATPGQKLPRLPAAWGPRPGAY
jgi:NADH-quinone oxidoreductase subunit M